MSVSSLPSSFALVSAAALCSCACGCKPAFVSTSSITVDGVPFRPTVCHVLGNPTGIALVDAGGARMELAIQPSRLDAWESVSGTPSLSYAPGPGAVIVTAGRCGSLTLTGEGYHGEGKRAASGRASLSCVGAVSVSGELTFEGCF